MHEKIREAYHNYTESSAKIIYSNPASDIVRSVKTTAYDQNNNIQRCFHILKAQKSSKSG